MVNGESKTEPSVFRFENVDDVVEGKLVAIRQGFYGNGVYDIQTKKGLVTVCGTKVLDSEIKPDYVGKKIRIVFLAEETSSNGFAYKKFSVSLNGKRSG